MQSIDTHCACICVCAGKCTQCVSIDYTYMHLCACSHFLILHVSGQPIPVIEEYISRDTAILLKLNAISVVMNTITGGQVLLVEQAAGNREKREATAFSSAALLNVSLEGGRFLYVLGLMPGQDYSFKVATVNDAAVSRFTEQFNITTTSAGTS